MQNAIALGTFDGLHTGHRRVLEKTQGYHRIAVSFDLPPKSFFGKAQLLMTNGRKNELLEKLGINEIKSLDFPSVRETEPEEFLEMLVSEYSPALISCGFNYRFGKDAKGNTDILKSFCDKKGIRLFVCEGVRDGGEVVSSTMLRSLIAEGNMERANSLIYGGFGFSAPVISGDRRGRTINFPTANQLLPEELVAPKFGVYKAKITVDGKPYDAITNIGIRPTYITDKPLCETHILNFSGDIYGKQAFLQPIRFIREEKKFSSLSMLKEAIARDIKSL